MKFIFLLVSKNSRKIRKVFNINYVGGILMEINPKVFISYSHDNKTFSDKVLGFSNKLRSEGIDTILDQYEESPSEGWPRWMENSIDGSDYVLIISSEGYLGKSKNTKEVNFGRGVKWESNIIYQKLYSSGTINTKYIPVVFNEEDFEYIPTPLQGATYYNINESYRYDALYWRLRGIKSVEKPELGKLKPLPEKERKSLFVSTPIDIEKWDKAGWKGTGFLLDPEERNIPYFLLVFSSENEAKKIFKEWQENYGKEDLNNEIRISIVEGDIQGEEKGYSISITPNYDQVTKRMIEMGMEGELILGISRTQRSIPKDNFKVFNLFKEQYKKNRKCYLIPAYHNSEKNEFKPFYEYQILKSNLEFRNIKDISMDDIDYGVFRNKIPQI